MQSSFAHRLCGNLCGGFYNYPSCLISSLFIIIVSRVSYLQAWKDSNYPSCLCSETWLFSMPIFPCLGKLGFPLISLFPGVNYDYHLMF